MEQYLAQLQNTDATLFTKFNATGRAYPDVSLQGANVLIRLAGQNKPDVFGTSASAPMFASMIGLLNDQLLNAGKRPLGFLNPLLYSTDLASVFNDITTGSNPGCGTNGFPALQGWDPVRLRP